MKKATLKVISTFMAILMMLATIPVNCFAHEFQDISYHWAKDDIEKLVENGVFSGVTKQKFEPNSNVTRGMFAVVVCRVLNEDPGDRVAFFKDVDNNKYYGPYIAWAFEKQILSGYDDMTFRADEPVTRQEMFSITTRLMKYQGVEIEPSKDYELGYEDEAEISDYALDSIKFLSENGYINGNEKNMINPNKPATRAELCVLIAKVMGLSEVTKVETTQETSEATTEVETETASEDTTIEETEEDSETTTEEATEVITETTTLKEKEETIKTTTQKETQAITEIVENLEQEPIANENSAKIILRNYKNVSLSYKDANGENVLTVTYFKRSGEYSCYAKISGGTEVYIDDSRKAVFEKTNTSRLLTYVNALDSYDKYFGNIFDEDINNIDFLEKYISELNLSEKVEINYDTKTAIPGFVSKLKTTSAGEVRKVTIRTEDESYSEDFVLNRDTIINIIGEDYEIFVDKECVTAYNYAEFISKSDDLVLYIKK